MTRHDNPTIEAILDRAERPIPEIRESVGLLCTDGKYRQPFGIPHGVEAVRPIVRKVLGYVYWDPQHSTTYAPKHFPTREDAEAWILESRRRRREEFRKELESMSSKRLQEQAAYWLK